MSPVTDVQFYSTPQTGLTQAGDEANARFVADTPTTNPRKAVAVYKRTGLVDPRTTTTETISISSRGKLVTFSNASAIAVTLDNTVPTDFLCAAQVIGAGAATFTPSSGTVNGVSNISLTTGQSAWFFYAGSNVWWALLGAGTSSGGGLNGAVVKTGDYTLLSGDNGKNVVMNSSSAHTFTLPSSPPSATWTVFLTSIGTGLTTINRNGLLIDGVAANLTLEQFQGISIWTDGTNYFTSGLGTGGDLAPLTPTSQEVVGILNKLIDGVAPTDGQIIQYSSVTGMWELLVDRPIIVASAVPGKPAAAQLVVIYTAFASMIFPGNFTSPQSYGTVGTNPTSTATYTVSKISGGVTTTVGTVVISTSGIFTFATTGGASFTLNAQDRLTVSAPGSQDATLSDVSITFVGTRTATVPSTVSTGIFTWRGPYNNATGYAVNDVVSYFGNVYVCINTTTGNAPTNTSFWSLAVQNQPGGALTFDYQFSTTTTNSDPGSGLLRLNNATQNTATAVYINTTDFNGTAVGAVLDVLDASNSATNKAYFRFTKKGDVTKWLLFNMTARISHTGYREFTLSNTASSAASPFANLDELLLEVSLTGNDGAAGGVQVGGDIGGTNVSPTVISTHLSSPLPVNQGGTGDATLAAHGVLVGNGTSAVSVTGTGSAGQVFTSNGASADPTFQPAAGSGLPSFFGTGNKRLESIIRSGSSSEKPLNGVDNTNSPTYTAATTSLPAYIVNWSGGFVMGQLALLTGKNIDAIWQGWIQSTSSAINWTLGIADANTSAGSGGATPAGKYALFRYIHGTDTNFQCMTSDGTTQSIVNSGVAVDTAIHTFEIKFNDGTPNVVFSIDGSTVATITTHLPGNGVLVRRGWFVSGGSSTTAFAESAFQVTADPSWP